LKRAIALVLCAGALSGCATGVSRPLGKCSESATRRPVAPERWPGGIEQLKSGQGTGEVKAPAAETAPPAAQQTVRANVPPRPAARLAPTPAPVAVPPSTPEPLPRSIEINPMMPINGSSQGAALPLGPEGACNG
jgi:hypothetical protein